MSRATEAVLAVLITLSCLVPAAAATADGPPEAPTVTSPTHAYGASRRGDITFEWVPSGQGTESIVGWSFVIDQAAATVPDSTVDTPGRTASATDRAPGPWYIHVRAIDDQGRAGPPAHFGVEVLESIDSSPDSVPSPPPAPTRWFMAEGSTGPGFDTWVLMANPTGNPVTARLTYLTPERSVTGPTVVVDARSRASVHVNDALTDYSVSTEVYSDGGPLIVERAMYINADEKQGTHSAAAVTAPSTSWAFPEGSTGPGFETWLLLANPGNEPAMARPFFQTFGAGGVQGPTIEIPPRSRRTLRVNNVVADYEVASLVTSDLPIYVERAMYILVGGSRIADTTGSVGATRGSRDWLVAAGASSGGFETFVLIQNPNPDPVLVKVVFDTPAGEIAPSELDGLVVSNGRRQTIRVNDWTDFDEVSTRVHADSGTVVVERASYFNRGSLRGATSDLGAGTLDTVWYVAEGSTAGGFGTFLLIANPDPTRVAPTQVSFLTPSGLVSGPLLQIGPESRYTVRESDIVGPELEVAAIVSSISGIPIAVERSTFGLTGAAGGRAVRAADVLDAAGL